MALLHFPGKIPALLTCVVSIAVPIAVSIVVSILTSMPALAHHSFAVFDFQTRVPFDGIIETIRFRNPHIAMTLKTVDETGKETIVDFIEGAPANMLTRNGLRPEMVRPGTHVIATGSPLTDDNNKYFLRLIRLDDGKEF